MIVKIQKPLFSAGAGVPQALIYNEDRSVELMVPYTDDMAEMFGNDVKQYWEAKMGEQPGGTHYLSNQITLFHKVAVPDW